MCYCGLIYQYTLILYLQKLLDEVKTWKARLGDVGEVEGLSFGSILQQQEDIIRALEDQIARLRQLLRLRQQFIALITDITNFITTYTGIVRDIEHSPKSTQEKIDNFNEVGFFSS